MNLFDQDLVLPGVVTEIISDYSSGYDTSLFGTTDSVAIIGTAFNGPVGKPVEIYSPEHASYVFGPSYDSKTRKEATLVGNIKDAWDRGCRTIYAIRISGKTISKDYQLCSDTNLKLRVSGIFPSNSNKDVCMVFNDDAFDMAISIFKPADRATINEKGQGLVDSRNSMLVNKVDLANGGIDKSDDLIDLIKRVNDFPYNNVLRLSIVDEKGNDVTLSSTDARSIKVGDMFPGIYTIGRDANAAHVKSNTSLELVLGTPYEGYEGSFYKKLSLNTNIAIDLPIFFGDEDLFELIGVSTIGKYDFLEVPGRMDSVFLKDKTDYEEVNISDFELYKTLGSGFAVNSSISVETDSHGKVKVKVREVADKATKKTEIRDGMYSALENLSSKYRVLAGVAADSQIKGRLPKANEFKFAKHGSLKLFGDAIEIDAHVDTKDLTAPKSYELDFIVEDVDVKASDITKALYSKKTVRQATLITAESIKTDEKEYKEGSLFLVTDVTGAEYVSGTNLLYTFSNGKFKSLHEFAIKGDILKDSVILAENKLYICSNEIIHPTNDKQKHTSFVEAKDTDFVLEDKTNAKYVIVCLDNGTFVIAELTSETIAEPNPPAEGGEGETRSRKAKFVRTAAAGLTATILGTVETLLDPNENEEKIVIALSSSYNDNKIVIKSTQFDFLTIDEVAEKLNKDKDFAKLFNIKILDITKAQEYIADLKSDVSVETQGILVDREIGYDTNLLIPFRTEDNFGRHLAQHCMYTSLKTSPTHGIMGTKVLLDMGLESISNRVKELVSIKLDSKFVAKKGNGTDMLDRNNMPYPIGRKISVIVGQYAVVTDDNFTFISNMAAGYAGMISRLPLDQSSTCQPISIPEPMFELTNYQLGALTTSGFVTIKKSYSKGWVITDGITMAPAGSAYKRLSASRISDGLEDIIRRVCEPYIGKQNHLANQNSLRSAIKSELDKLKDKLIEQYDFRLVSDRQATKLGRIDIDYSVVPIYEIKSINNRITVRE